MRSTAFVEGAGLWVWRRPLPLCAVGLVVGIVVFGQQGRWWAVAAVTVALALGMLRRSPWAVLLLPLAFGLAGSALPGTALVPPLDLVAGQATLFEGVVLQAPERRLESQVYLLQLSAIAPTVDGPWTPQSGRLRLSIHEPATLGSRSCGRPGDRVRVWARPRRLQAQMFAGGFDSATAGRRRGLLWRASARSTQACASVGQSGFSFEQLRHRLHEVIDAALPQHQAAVVRAFATGDRAAISKQTQEDFQISGLSHLLAVSGLNLAIVAGLFVFGVRWLLCWMPPVTRGPGAHRVAAVIAIPAVGAYTLIVGASPSSVRAALMVTAVLLAQIWGQGRQVHSALAAAVILMVGHEPSIVYDVSFQLSVVAVVALLRGQPWLRLLNRALPAAIQPVAAVIACSLFATLGTAPLVAHHFGRVSIIGLLSNVPAAPLSSFVLVPASFGGAVLASWDVQLGAYVLWLAGQAGEWLCALARWSAEVPFASLTVARLSPIQSGLLAAAFWLGSSADFRRARIAGALLLSVCVAVQWAGAGAAHEPEEVRITVLPVGQGDAAVIESGGRAALIDSGPPAFSPQSASAVQRVVLPFLRGRGIRRLDWVILTHPHADHIGGLEALSKELDIGELWWTGDRREAQPGLLEPLKSMRALQVGPGFVAELGAARLSVMGPLRPARTYDDINDGSLVVQLRLGQQSVLFTGDAERESEAELVAHFGEALRSQVLMLGHHGSRSSSTQDFVNAVQPRVTIASCGPHNRFGFVHKEVEQRLSHTRLFRTDRDGAVTVRLTKAGLFVSAHGDPDAGFFRAAQHLTTEML